LQEAFENQTLLQPQATLVPTARIESTSGNKPSSILGPLKNGPPEQQYTIFFRQLENLGFRDKVDGNEQQPLF